MSALPTPKSMMVDSWSPSMFFEHIAAMSCVDGVYCLNLATSRPVPMFDGTLMNELVSSGHVRGTRHALLQLRDAIDRILAMEVEPHQPSSEADAAEVPDIWLYHWQH